MLRLIWITSIHTAVFLRAWMPSNIILDRLRTRQGLKWGIPAMGLAIPYIAVAYWCTALIDAGAPGWLHLIVMACIWSAFKFLIMGPISFIALLRSWLATGIATANENRNSPMHRVKSHSGDQLLTRQTSARSSLLGSLRDANRAGAVRR